MTKIEGGCGANDLVSNGRNNLDGGAISKAAESWTHLSVDLEGNHRQTRQFRIFATYEVHPPFFAVLTSVELLQYV